MNRFLEALLIGVATGVAIDLFLSSRRRIQSQVANPDQNELRITFKDGRVLIVDTEGFLVKFDSLTA